MMFWSLILMHFEFKKAELQDCLTQVICCCENGNLWVSSFYHHQRTDSRTHCSCLWHLVSYLVIHFVSTIINLPKCRRSTETAGEKWQEELWMLSTCITWHFYFAHNSSLLSVCGRFYIENTLTFFFFSNECNAAGRKRESARPIIVLVRIFRGKLKSLMDANYHFANLCCCFSASPKKSSCRLLQHYG